MSGITRHPAFCWALTTWDVQCGADPVYAVGVPGHHSFSCRQHLAKNVDQVMTASGTSIVNVTPIGTPARLMRSSATRANASGREVGGDR